MKRIILIFTLLCSYFLANAQLNGNANYIKEKFPSEYEKTLKKYALKEWNDDYSMVVYEINKQADALVQLVNNFESDNTQIVFNAIHEWSRDGYKNFNIEEFNKLTTFSIKNLLKLHCDWSMVKYEYDKQVKAKNSF
jgi:predicted RNA-binding protein